MEHFVEDLNESDVEQTDRKADEAPPTPITWFGG